MLICPAIVSDFSVWCFSPFGRDFAELIWACKIVFSLFKQVLFAKFIFLAYFNKFYGQIYDVRFSFDESLLNKRLTNLASEWILKCLATGHLFPSKLHYPLLPAPLISFCFWQWVLSSNSNCLHQLQTSRPDYNQMFVKKPGGPEFWPF